MKVRCSRCGERVDAEDAYVIDTYVDDSGYHEKYLCKYCEEDGWPL